MSASPPDARPASGPPGGTLDDPDGCVPVGSLAVRPDGQVVRADQTFLGWLGRPDAEVVGARLAALLQPGSRLLFETQLSPILQVEGQLEQVALEFARGDGGVFHALASWLPLREPDGRPIGHRITVVDAGARFAERHGASGVASIQPDAAEAAEGHESRKDADGAADSDSWQGSLEAGLDLRAVFANVPACVAVFDEEGRILDCNAAVETLSGWTRDQLLGLSCRDFRWLVFHEDGAPYAEQEHPVYRALREGRFIADALIGWIKPGEPEPVWLSGNVNPIIGCDGRRLAIFSFNDITSEIESRCKLAGALDDARKALSELGAYKVALDQDSLVVMLDTDFRITYVNDLFCRTSGYRREEMLGEKIGPLIDSEFHPRSFYDKLHADVAAGKTVRLELCNRARDGRHYWVDETVVPIRDAGGAVTGYIGISSDITERVMAEQALRESEARYRLLADNSSDVIILGHNDGRRSYFSPSIERLTGYTSEEALALSLHDWVHPEDLPGLFAATNSLSDHNPRVVTSYRLRRKDGAYVWVEVVFARVRGGGGTPDVVASARDITRRKAIELERQALFDNAMVGIYRRRLDGVLTSANPTLVRIRGYAAEAELLDASRRGAARWHVDAGRKAERDRLLMQDGLVRDFIYEVHVRHGQGRIWVSETSWVVRDDAGAPRHIEGMVEDVTERVLAERRLAHQARHDPVTDLPNRLAFREALDRSIADARDVEAIQILYIDLDRFKSVNDTLGHAAGDELLARVAERLRDVASPGLIARLGGDEFAILCRADTDPNLGERTAIRIIAAINHPIVLASGHAANIGASIGIAVAKAGETDGEQTMRRADLAMYQAKRDGRNAYRWHHAALDAQIHEREAMEKGLRHTLKADAFALHFQPIYALAGRQLSGFEALLRWPCPERGFISPALFIPVAEDAGLMVPIGRWVLREAFREAVRWPAPLKIAVNVSVVQFRHPEFLEHVRSALHETGIDPGRVVLEMTESVLLEDQPETFSLLNALQALGLSLALDDFGTGWSSLSYLTRHRFDRIKIDRSFVQGMEDRRNAAIVKAILAMARELGIPVTAEGIETDGQLEWLRGLDCDEGQGFHLGRPASAEAVRAAIRTLHPHAGPVPGRAGRTKRSA